jgi:hypothetical protein
MGSVPQGTWQHQSLILSGGVLCATGHVTEPELSGTGSGSGAMGTHGGTRALSYRVRSLEL